MGFRFRRSIKILPGIRLNFSKKGFSSVSIGRRGATLNINRKGEKRATIGIPGTGLSWQTRLDVPVGKGRMTQCPFCGHRMRKRWDRCPECGRLLVVEAPPEHAEGQTPQETSPAADAAQVPSAAPAPSGFGAALPQEAPRETGAAPEEQDMEHGCASGCLGFFVLVVLYFIFFG